MEPEPRSKFEENEKRYARRNPRLLSEAVAVGCALLLLFGFLLGMLRAGMRPQPAGEARVTVFEEASPGSDAALGESPGSGKTVEASVVGEPEVGEAETGAGAAGESAVVPQRGEEAGDELDADGAAPPGEAPNDSAAEEPSHGAGATDLAWASDGPMLALVIDDWGYAWEAAGDFLALDVPLNVAVIPHLPHSRRHAEAAAARGHLVLLHLPMEPLSPNWDLGEGAVTTAMASSDIYRAVVRSLDSLPGVRAVNNHMGSKATADPRVMRTVLEAIGERGLFFLDSRTTADSVAAEVAGELGVPVLLNDRFIDPDLNPERIKERLLGAAAIAERRGWAIVIGHVHPETYEGVVRALPELATRGIRLVYLQEILEKLGG